MSVFGIRICGHSTAPRTQLAGTTLLSAAVLVAAAAALLAPQTASAQALAVSKGRQLAPDALEVIRPSAEWGETFQGPVDLPLVAKYPDLAWTPKFDPTSRTLIEKSKQVTFRGDVYCLEFAFKPVRMIEVDVNTPIGIQRKLVWYMVYRVRYLGGDLKPTTEPDKFNNEVYATPKAVSAEWVRFLPTFNLDTLALGKTYLDQAPLDMAKRAIAERERIGKPLYDSIELQRLKIERSTETADKPVWGVAMWTDVDPRTDFFTVQVKGLTNAQQIESEAGSLKYLQKSLVLHFSRPGDTLAETEDQIRFGIPALQDPVRQKYVLEQFGQEERLDYVWDYR